MLFIKKILRNSANSLAKFHDDDSYQGDLRSFSDFLVSSLSNSKQYQDLQIKTQEWVN